MTRRNSIGNRCLTINELKKMRKIYSFMVAAVAIFAAASCNKELPQGNELPVGETVVYTASVDGADTKAVLNEETKKSEWVAGDAITVHDGTKGWKFVADKAGQHTDFSNSEGFGDFRPVMAVYPAAEVFEELKLKTDYEYTSNVAAKTARAYIPTWQQAQAGTYHNVAALAVAYSEGNTFAFKNAHALLKFTVNTDNVTHVIFHGNGSEAITGDVNVTLGEDGVESVECLETEFTEQKWNEETQKNEDVKVKKYGTWVEYYAYHDDANKYFTKGQTYYIAVAPQEFKGGVTVKVKIDGGEELVAKSTTKPVETKINTILNLGEIKYDAPVVHEWAVAGTFNGWSTTANPMVQEGDFYVAKGITGLNNTPGETESSTGFKFVQNGNVWKGSGENGGVMIAGSWNYIWDDNGCNICVDGATAETAYDIYLNPAEGDHGKFVIVAAGADMPEDKPAEEPEVDASAYGLVGSFQGWDAANPVAMEYVSDGWIVAKNVEMYKDDAFKFVQGKSWDVNYGTSGATTLEDDKETSVVKDGQNMAVLKNGKYNLYLNPNKMLVKAVCIAEFTDLTVAITIDNKANWSPLTITLKKEGNVIVNKESVTNGKYVISGNYIGSTLVCQFHSGNKASKEEELTITKNGAKATVESTEVEKPKLYLTPNSNWKVDNARFAAYFFGNGEKWVSMTDPDKDGVYEVEIPSGYPNVIFCRMNPSASANNWNNKWNQTADLVIPTNGNNHYTVKAGTWDKGGGTWSKK